MTPLHYQLITAFPSLFLQIHLKNIPATNNEHIPTTPKYPKQTNNIQTLPQISTNIPQHKPNKPEHYQAVTRGLQKIE
jgi:hypothetical protein